mgnify:CR=1 FL=1|tara:strand:+ start:165 stop:413 length:249 start_codon:yes stop_codon:yes gene_type:complete
MSAYVTADLPPNMNAQAGPKMMMRCRPRGKMAFLFVPAAALALAFFAGRSSLRSSVGSAPSPTAPPAPAPPTTSASEPAAAK